MEHRRRERLAISKHILCHHMDSEDLDHHVKYPFMFEVVDMSYGGMRILSEHLLLKNDLLYFKLNHDSLKRDFKVRVKWSQFKNNQYVSGLEFVDLTREDIIFLFAFFKDLPQEKKVNGHES